MSEFKLFSLILISSTPFLFSLVGNFVFDDSEAIVKNKDVSSDSWFDTFYNDFWGTNIKSNLSHKSYRPLTTMSFKLNYYINNKTLSASQFKATNLLLHIVCCLLVWLSYNAIWRRVKREIKGESNLDIPYFAALLFCTHPIHVEAVSGIVGRADILAAITYFWAFLMYNKALDEDGTFIIYFTFSIILSGISMLFKENGITVLGYCCIYDILSKYKIRNYKSVDLIQNRNCILRVIGVVICLLLLLYARWIVMGGTKPEFKVTDNPAAFSGNIFTKIATYNYIYLLNALILVWPQWLCYDWSMGCVPLIKDMLDYRIVFIICLYIYGVIFVLKCINFRTKRINRIFIFSFLLIAIPFMPAANIFYPVGFVIAERILYIPSGGYCLLICIGLEKLQNKCNKLKLPSLVLFYFTVLIFGLKSYQRAYDWQNEYKLFVSGLAVCPLNAKVHYNVAKAADANNYTNWAISEYKTAMKLYPEYYQAMNNLANLLKNEKKYLEAESLLRSAIACKTDFAAAWMNLGIVLANTKRYEQSQQAYTTALRYRRKYPDCYYNLGNLYLELNKSQSAIENWYKAIETNPAHVAAWTNLLALLDNTDQTNTALNIIPKALEALPHTPSINFAIANIYGKLGQYETAEKHFLKAIEMYGNKVQAIHYANLGVLYHRWKKMKLAAKMYRMALMLNPNFSSAKNNLEKLNKILN